MNVAKERYPTGNTHLKVTQFLVQAHKLELGTRIQIILRGVFKK